MCFQFRVCADKLIEVVSEKILKIKGKHIGVAGYYYYYDADIKNKFDEKDPIDMEKNEIKHNVIHVQAQIKMMHNIYN